MIEIAALTLLATTLLAGLSACNKGAGTNSASTSSAAPATPGTPAAGTPATSTPPVEDTAAKGAAVYASANCAMCHGADGEGKALGPALTGLKQNWTPEDLVAYLIDPQAVTAKDPRLSENAKAYKMKMPAQTNLTDEQLNDLAMWLLTK